MFIGNIMGLFSKTAVIGIAALAASTPGAAASSSKSSKRGHADLELEIAQLKEQLNVQQQHLDYIYEYFELNMTAPTDALAKKGRCAWTEQQCTDLGHIINKDKQNVDVATTHDQICDAFASYGQYPPSLHCPLANQTLPDSSEKSIWWVPSNGFPTCNGYVTNRWDGKDLRIVFKKSFVAYHLLISAESEIIDRECGKKCDNDIRCKASVAVAGHATEAYTCSILYESDSLNSDYDSLVCGFGDTEAEVRRTCSHANVIDAVTAYLKDCN